MRHLKHLLLAVTVMAAMVSCAGASPGAELAGTRWVLEAHGKPGALKQVLEGAEITADFEADGEVSGSAGCNQYSATYAIAGKELTFAQLAFTEMACLEPAGVMEQEQAFLSALQGVQQFKLADGQLQLLTADGWLLTFRAA
jgi:heat shock protein HslJ